jgi:hypothetical protein
VFWRLQLMLSVMEGAARKNLFIANRNDSLNEENWTKIAQFMPSSGNSNRQEFGVVEHHLEDGA